MRYSFIFISMLLGLFLVSACESDLEGKCAEGLQDNDGDGICTASCALLEAYCGDRGCDDSSGTAICGCEPGYTGAECAECAEGFQDNDTDGTCLPDCASAAFECGHGTCSDASGTAACVCDEGYEGEQCASCAAGYQDNDEDGTCVAGCALTDLVCENGTCSDVSGTPVCECDPQHAGDTCVACAEGLQDHDGNFTCEPDCDTAALACGNGACSDASGTAACVCDTGYAGTACDMCDAGYQDNDLDGTCAPDCATAGLVCVNGACDDLSGVAGCVCEGWATGALCDECLEGFQGEGCDFCASGYQDWDGDGECLPTCETAALACVAGYCEDWDGSPACVCDGERWAGELCDACAPGYTGLDCDACDTGYVDVQGDGNCLPGCSVLTCGANSSCIEGDGSPAYCSCDDGYQDNDGDGTCAPNCDMADLVCGENGYCQDWSGIATCNCYQGWGGSDCSVCADGHVGEWCDECAEGWAWASWGEGGECLPTCAAGLTDCGPHGYCVNDDYSDEYWGDYYFYGTYCGCYIGYQDDDDDGVCEPTCETAGFDCGGHGSCFVYEETGLATCSCDEGYTGPACGSCGPGYQDWDMDGTCEMTCDYSELVCEGGVCDDSTGRLGCACDPGYQDNDRDYICTETCATAGLSCDVNEVCSDASGTAECVCTDGYQDRDGDGSCLANCATAGITCTAPEICVEWTGEAACGHPWACSDIRESDPGATDGHYTLFAGGDYRYPWQVWCQDMAGTPAEYLDVDPDTNYSSYVAGGHIYGTDVVTRWSRVRIDPISLRVKLDDFTFSTSTGYINGWGMTEVGYATAGACNWWGQAGTAGIDLTDSRFEIVESFCAGGWAAWGSLSPTDYTNQVTLYGGGQCGSMEPCTVTDEDNDGFRLELALLPCPDHKAGPECDVCEDGWVDPDGSGTCVVPASGLPLGALVVEGTRTWRIVEHAYGGDPALVTLQATGAVAPRVLNDEWNNRWYITDLRAWLNDPAGFRALLDPAFLAIVEVTPVQWTIENPVSAEVSSGVTDDQVFIASWTELGGESMAGDGSVLAWYADPATAQARRDLDLVYWTRTGANGYYGAAYDMSAYYVLEDGTSLKGAWVTDAFGTIPVVNVDAAAYFLPISDDTFTLWIP